MTQYFNQVSYGLTQGLINEAPLPVLAKRAPTVNDRNYALGTLWIYVPANLSYILTSVVNNLATWSSPATGGALTASSLTVTGPVLLATTGASASSIGNTTGASLLALSAGTLGISLGTSPTGTISVGLSTMTGLITLGASTAGQTINIGNAANTGTQVINIASGASGANSTVNILTGNGTAGTQTLNLLTGTRAGAVNIGSGAAANTVIIGSTTGAASTILRAGTAGITLSAPFVALPGPVYIYTGAGVPANGLALHTGDLYINTTAATAATRLYIATGVGAWTFFTANA